MANAAALGNLTVHSWLGEPLHAHIDIVSLAPGEGKDMVARLASRAAFRRAGIEYHAALAGIRVAIDRSKGRALLRLRTTRPVNEPFLELLVELRSNSGVQLRRYTVLLDPRGYQGAQAAIAAPAKPAAAAASRPAPAEAPTAEPQPATPKPAAALSREELFGLPKVSSPKPPAKPVEWRGFVQNYTAYDYKQPSHWSRAVVRTQLGAQGGAGDLKWKAAARLDLDPVYAASDFYPSAVRRDQRRDFFLRETYVDTKAGAFELRLGKQNIVWGEMVGLFFADIVSARDLRDFVLPDFEIIRIPQWAARAEYFGERSHAELIWLPYPEVDDIGKPGAEFYPVQTPAPAGFNQEFNNVVRPARQLRHSNFGTRVSTLRNGWDLSAFYYRSTDVNPTFHRDVTFAPTPKLTFTPRHERIWQVGGTVGKDLGPTVAKAEVIYASGRKYNVIRLTEPTGVVPQNTLDYVVGLDFTLGRDTRLNVQYFERVFFDHDPDLLQDRRERGATLLVSGKLGAAFEPELLLIQSLNRNDRLVRTKLGWLPGKNWRVTFGIDVFSGPVTGLAGRFEDNDRAYVELRYDF